MIALVTEVTPEQVYLRGSGGFTATAGKHIKIEVSPGGEEIMDAVVPAGKKWSGTISLQIKEENA